VATTSIRSQCTSCGAEHDDDAKFCPDCGVRLSESGVRSSDFFAPGAGMAAAPVAPQNQTVELLAQQSAVFWLALLAGAVMVIGGIGTWATALNFISVSGTRGDGWIVIAAAVVAIGCLWACVLRGSVLLGLVAIACGVGGAVVSAIDLHKVAAAPSVNFFGQQLNVVRPGWGLYADVAGSVALAGLVAALLIWWRPRKRAALANVPAADYARATPPAGHPRRMDGGRSEGDRAQSQVWPPTSHAVPAVGSASSDRPWLIGLVAAGLLILVSLGVALYVGGVFNSTRNPRLAPVSATTSAPPPGTTPAPLAAPSQTATPRTQQPVTSTPQLNTPSAPSAPSNPSQGPSEVLRTHLQDLGTGDYRAAFRLMSPSYQAQSPAWLSDRAAADPAINVVSVGTPQYGSGSARVAVDFYARDRNSTASSDTKCREFQGTAALIRDGGAWRYDPGGNSLTATVVSPGNPNCPS
jgi:hypothetical protein